MSTFTSSQSFAGILKQRLVQALAGVVGAFHKRFSPNAYWGKAEGLGYIPRWSVLMIDMSIVLFSVVFTMVVLRDVGLHYINMHQYVAGVVVFSAVNLLIFNLYKIYAGIIRHSSLVDVTKIFVSQLTTFCFLWMINFSIMQATGIQLFLNLGLFINVVVSAVLLFFYRLVIKHVFANYIHKKVASGLETALVIGTTSNAIAIANALTNESPARFRIAGFVDNSSQSSAKRIFNLPIYHFDMGISELMRSEEATCIIVADPGVFANEEENTIEACLAEGSKVYNMSVVSNWNDQKEIATKVKKFQIQDLLERKPIVINNQSLTFQLKGKTIMITGAAGSIGSEIVRQVLKYDPAHVVVLDQAETPLHDVHLEIKKLNSSAQIHSVIADIRDGEAMEMVFRRFTPEIVYHAAAYKHVPIMEENPAQAIFTNVMGTKNLADLAVKYEVNKFVMVSTDKAVNPSSVMGASKRIAEKYVQSLFCDLERSYSKKTKFITTRFGNVLGSNGSVVPLFTRQIEEMGPVTITHPDIIRYFMTIPEACQLVLEAGSMGKGGEIYIFDMGKPVKILDLAKKMIRLAGYVPDKDIKIQFTGLRPGEKLYEELLNDAAKTLPTYHEKIMIAQDPMDEFAGLSQKIDLLINTAKTYDSHEIVLQMKGIVPEFKSMNSTFQNIDNIESKLQVA